MTPSNAHDSHRPRTTLRGVILAVLTGLVLGALISVAIVWLRPVPTGIAEVAIIELEHRGASRSWVMELEADRAGYPYLIHVDDHGLASLLFPDQEIQAIDVGQRRRLPDETGHRAWRSPGGEVFVMISGTPYLALDRVLSRTERAAAGADTDADAVRAVRKLLREQLGPGVFVELPEIN
jgi:hypothetical protein